ILKKRYFLNSFQDRNSNGSNDSGYGSSNGSENGGSKGSNNWNRRIQ
ncbi:32214_t:CDS:1, partial [Gigaspora margarita]